MKQVAVDAVRTSKKTLFVLLGTAALVAMLALVASVYLGLLFVHSGGLGLWLSFLLAPSYWFLDRNGVKPPFDLLEIEADEEGESLPFGVASVADPEHRARPAGRALQRYLEMKGFQDSKDRPYIHLVDGGVSDNIGVRGVLEALEELSASAAFRNQVGFGNYRRIVVIVVNSRSSPKTDWDRHETPPGFVVQLLQASGVPIDRYSFETVETMKDRAEIQKWRRKLLVAQARLAGLSKAQAEAKVPEVALEVVDVSFDAIKDPAERARFMNLPTSFVLPPQDVDGLRDVAGGLMRQSADYESVVRAFGGTPAQ